MRLARIEFDPGGVESVEPVRIVPRAVPADTEPLTADRILAELAAIDERDGALRVALARERISVARRLPVQITRAPDVAEPESIPPAFTRHAIEAPVAEEPEWLPVAYPPVPPAEAVAPAPLHREFAPAPRAWPTRSVRRRELKYFVAAVLGLTALLVGLGLAGRAMAVKAVVEVRVLAGFERLAQAEGDLRRQDLAAAERSFRQAAGAFREARASLGWSGSVVLAAAERWPFPFSAKEGFRVLNLGESLAAAGVDLTGIAERTLSGALFRSLLSGTGTDGDELGQIGAALTRADDALGRAVAESARISVGRLPPATRERFKTLRTLLPVARAGVHAAKDEFDRWAPLLGTDTPRRYLIVFQNPSELRPTGGFIGTYAVVALDRGHIEELTVNGIFDPDGQLSVKVVPPHPVKRVSTAWSTHDANWFFDYPTSAKKIAWFFGKTGEPTVDGVIAVTPAVLVRLLEIVGPIEMPAYGEVVSAENFVEVVQREVELEYDRTVNRPKQFLADLVPQVLERLKTLDRAGLAQVVQAITESIAQKDILTFLTDPALQADMVRQGVAGSVAETAGDYLAVVHTNLNGYKSDYVTDDEFTHEATIEPDGSVVDTVTIRRTHRGGATPYFFWNQVNAEWLRVYVPKGSELISVEGATRSELADPIDYDAAGFRRDPDVVAHEATERIDPASGTVISEEAHKTVFGNWVFVSPGRSVEVRYRYRLPWKISSNNNRYTLLWQKQPGTAPAFTQRVSSVVWRMVGEASQSGVLDQDRSVEVSFVSKP